MAIQTLPGLMLVLIALQAVADPRPAELVRQLAAPKYEDRAAAGEALAKLGRAAVPALLKAGESRDPEVRLRAETLVARIEAGEILDATRISLDVRDRPLAEAAEAIVKASGLRLRPGGTPGGKPEVDPTWAEQRVSLETAEPIPFWNILDRLCREGGLQREYTPAGNRFLPFKSAFDLTLVPGKSRPPASDAGALRVELLCIRHRRERNYGDHNREFSTSRDLAARNRNAQTGVTESSSYTAELLVSAEPRLRIFGVGAIEKPEALDDQARSLLKTPTAEEETQQQALWRMNPHLDPRLHPSLRYGAGTRTSMGTWPVSFPLSYLSPPARRIASLRGVIPVVVVARRPDPLVVALKDASGKEFSAGSTKIRVHKIRAESGQEPTIDLTLETPRLDDGETIMVCDPKGTRLAVNRPIDLMELRLEVLDSRGESLFWQFTSAPTERTQGRMGIVIHDRDSKGSHPDELRLRYWGVIGAATDLPFAFENVATP